jgi:PAS domain S-box-containing protein
MGATQRSGQVLIDKALLEDLHELLLLLSDTPDVAPRDAEQTTAQFRASALERLSQLLLSFESELHRETRRGRNPNSPSGLPGILPPPAWLPGEGRCLPKNSFPAAPVVEDSKPVEGAGPGVNQDDAQRAEEQYRLVVESIPQLVWMAQSNGVVDYFNQQWQEYTGFSQQRLLSEGARIAVHPEHRQRMEAEWLRSLRTGNPYEAECQLRRADGEYRWHIGRATPVRGGDGQILRWLGTCTDIEEQKRVEQTLRGSEGRFRAFIDHAADALFLVDPDGVILDVNLQACESLGYTRDELIGMGLSEIDPNVSPAAPQQLVKPEAGGTVTFDSRHRRKDGSVFPVEVRTRLIRIEDTLYRLSLARDLTDRKRAEEALRRSEEMLRQAEAIAHVGAWTYEVDEGVYYCSEEGGRIGGCAPGPHPAEALNAKNHPDDLPYVKAAIEATLAGAPLEMEHRLLADGRVKWVHVQGQPEQDASGRVVRVVGATQDITKRRMLEEQFRQAQKMEAVGRLAGGIAHDFNNMLAVINGYSELLLLRTPFQDPAHAQLQEIRSAGERAQALTGQLLLFSRQQSVEQRVIQLNEVIVSMEKLLFRLLGEDVMLSTLLAPDLGQVLADRGQIEQVLMNLAVNARDAMPQGGTLIIETANVTLDRTQHQRGVLGAPPGDYLLLGVTDTGTGMDDETMAHIFEPFFTTKQVGVGTGLGLATVYGVVEQSRGDIVVSSDPGWGTTFKIYLPRVTSRRSGQSAKGTTTDALPGVETVLVVEDDALVRGLVLSVLKAQGYTLLQAAGGEDALQICEQHPDPIHLVITDVVMPRMSGREVAEAIRMKRPEARVLFMSGYTDDAVLLRGVSSREAAFIQKPFSPSALARKVREMLDAPGEGVLHLASPH